MIMKTPAKHALSSWRIGVALIVLLIGIILLLQSCPKNLIPA